MRSTVSHNQASIQVPDIDTLRVFGEPARASMTVEVRWINPGSVPEAMVAWLGPFDDRIERRVDRYLVDPSVSDLGVKIRDSVQFDVKARRGSLGKLQRPGAVRGRVELWEKWSFPLHPGVLPPADAAGWVAIEKARRRRSFEVDRGEVVERPLSAAKEPGCTIELTEISMGPDLWWTLDIEAIGSRAVARGEPPVDGRGDVPRAVAESDVAQSQNLDLVSPVAPSPGGRLRANTTRCGSVAGRARE